MHHGERTLDGLRVAVTRPREQADDLVAELERRGARALVQPLIRIAGPADAAPLRRAATRAGAYDWIVFTSANGVRRFMDALDAVDALDAPGSLAGAGASAGASAGAGAGALAGVRVACVGPSTARALAEYGVTAEVVPPRYVADSIVDELVDAQLRPAGSRGRADEPTDQPEDASADASAPASTGDPTDAATGAPAGAPGGARGPLVGLRILLPLAAGARPVLAEALAARGAAVERVEAYRTVSDAVGAAELHRRLVEGGVDVITFTSPSAVESFVEAGGADLRGAVAAAIGPITARAARRLGLAVDVVAEEHTVAGLVEALARRLGRERGGATGV